MDTSYPTVMTVMEISPKPPRNAKEPGSAKIPGTFLPLSKESWLPAQTVDTPTIHPTDHPDAHPHSPGAETSEFSLMESGPKDPFAKHLGISLILLVLSSSKQSIHQKVTNIYF